jgi:hypothetical protein
VDRDLAGDASPDREEHLLVRAVCDHGGIALLAEAAGGRPQGRPLSRLEEVVATQGRRQLSNRQQAVE